MAKAMTKPRDKKRSQKRSDTTLLIVRLRQASLALAGVFALWITGFGLFASASLNIAPSAGVTTSQSSDSVIVLTGGKQRIEEGLRLFAQGTAPQLFITGVHPSTSMADIIARYDGAAPLPTCCITIDQIADTTITNAQQAYAWQQGQAIQSAHLVTSNYHFLRAAMEFRAIMPDLEIIPHPITPPAGSYEERVFWRLMMEEYHKYLFRALHLMILGAAA